MQPRALEMRDSIVASQSDEIHQLHSCRRVLMADDAMADRLHGVTGETQY